MAFKHEKQTSKDDGLVRPPAYSFFEAGMVEINAAYVNLLYFVLWLLSVLVALFVGGFLKSYMSKKGENLATKEDIHELTRVQREIEARISGELWQTQKQFEMKKDALLTVITELPNAENHLMMMYSQLRDGRQTVQERKEMLMDYNKAFVALERAIWPAELVSGAEVRVALYTAKSIFVQMANYVLRGDYQEYENQKSDFVKSQTSLHAPVRKELKVDDEVA